MSKLKIFKLVFPVTLFLVLILWGENQLKEYAEDLTLKTFKPLFYFVQAASSQEIFLSDDANQPMKLLSAENQKLKAGLFELEELRSEVKSLKKLLRFSEGRKLELRGAHVLHYGKVFGKEFLILDQGRQNGFGQDLPVLDENGFFVGTLKEVTEDFSKVEIASNPGETFEIEIIPVQVRALAKGIGGRAFGLELVPLDSTIRVGDLVLSFSQYGKNRVPFYLGEITKVEPDINLVFKKAKATLLTKPEGLREVFIVLAR